MVHTMVGANADSTPVSVAGTRIATAGTGIFAVATIVGIVNLMGVRSHHPVTGLLTFQMVSNGDVTFYAAVNLEENCGVAAYGLSAPATSSRVATWSSWLTPMTM